MPLVPCRLVFDAVTGLLEAALDELADREDEQDDDGRDGGDEEAVLNGGGALVGVAGLDLADKANHVDVPSVAFEVP